MNFKSRLPSLTQTRLNTCISVSDSTSLYSYFRTFGSLVLWSAIQIPTPYWFQSRLVANQTLKSHPRTLLQPLSNSAVITLDNKYSHLCRKASFREYLVNPQFGSRNDPCRSERLSELPIISDTTRMTSRYLPQDKLST